MNLVKYLLLFTFFTLAIEFCVCQTADNNTEIPDLTTISTIQPIAIVQHQIDQATGDDLQEAVKYVTSQITNIVIRSEAFVGNITKMLESQILHSFDVAKFTGEHDQFATESKQSIINCIETVNLVEQNSEANIYNLGQAMGRKLQTLADYENQEAVDKAKNDIRESIAKAHAEINGLIADMQKYILHLIDTVGEKLITFVSADYDSTKARDTIVMNENEIKQNLQDLCKRINFIVRTENDQLTEAVQNVVESSTNTTAIQPDFDLFVPSVELNVTSNGFQPMPNPNSSMTGTNNGSNVGQSAISPIGFKPVLLPIDRPMAFPGIQDDPDVKDVQKAYGMFNITMNE